MQPGMDARPILLNDAGKSRIRLQIFHKVEGFIHKPGSHGNRFGRFMRPFNRPDSRGVQDGIMRRHAQPQFVIKDQVEFRAQVPNLHKGCPPHKDCWLQKHLEG